MLHRYVIAVPGYEYTTSSADSVYAIRDIDRSALSYLDASGQVLWDMIRNVSRSPVLTVTTGLILLHVSRLIYGDIITASWPVNAHTRFSRSRFVAGSKYNRSIYAHSFIKACLLHRQNLCKVYHSFGKFQYSHITT